MTRLRLPPSFSKNQLNAKTIFIVDDKTTYSQGLADGVSKAAKELGMEVVEHDHVNQGDKDFAAVLTKAKQANADVFYMSLQGYSPGALMALQAKRIGMTSQIVTQDAMFQPKFMEVAKDAAEGVYLTYGFTDKTTPEYKAFEKIYVPKYGPIAAYATYAYDAATVLLRPSRTPDPPTRPKSRPRS
jgi:branched-chain amino acid transport system substrate-binding protein